MVNVRRWFKLCLLSAVLAACSAPVEQEPAGSITSALNACNETVPANRFVDGFPAYAQCSGISSGSIYSNNGIDTSATSMGSDWVLTQRSGGYQCTEWAFRYMHFRWKVDYRHGDAKDWCDGTLPAGLVKSTAPMHGDLVVFDAGVCGVDATYGHVAVIDAADDAGALTIVEENNAGRRKTKASCALCFLHAVANDGSTGGESGGGASGSGGGSNRGGASSSGGASSGGGAVNRGGASSGGVANGSGAATSGGGMRAASGNGGRDAGEGGRASGGTWSGAAGGTSTSAGGASGVGRGGTGGATFPGGSSAGQSTGGSFASMGSAGASNGGPPGSSGVSGGGKTGTPSSPASNDAPGCSISGATGATGANTGSVFGSVVAVAFGLWFARRRKAHGLDHEPDPRADAGRPRSAQRVFGRDEGWAIPRMPISRMLRVGTHAR